MQSFIHGFAIGLSLIIAIGAQNAFVLKQGLKRQYVVWVCLFCAVSDAILILWGGNRFCSYYSKFSTNFNHCSLFWCCVPIVLWRTTCLYGIDTKPKFIR